MTDRTTSKDESIAHRTLVRDRYGAIARGDADVESGARREDGRGRDDRHEDAADCCEPTCCGESGDGLQTGDAGSNGDAATRSLGIGYDASDLESIPDGANLGLGCGNPVAIAALEPGETVLDLGSGGGFDCFLAAREVGPDGRVIGVDATPEMVERARANAIESDLENVEFRLGEIEHLPVADGSVDAIVSNCVVNLSPEKPRAFAEAARVLRPGGRLSISDLVTTGPLPDTAREDDDLLAGCVGGAATVADLESWLDDAGFEDVEIVVESEWDAEHDGEPLPIVSARIEGRKPASGE